MQQGRYFRYFLTTQTAQPPRQCAMLLPARSPMLFPKFATTLSPASEAIYGREMRTWRQPVSRAFWN